MSENKQVWISALACGICGAPMYPDMKAGAFAACTVTVFVPLP